MAELIRQRVLRRMDAQVGQGRGNPESVGFTMDTPANPYRGDKPHVSAKDIEQREV